MLQSQLLRAFVRNGKLHLRWALGREEELNLASDLISIFKQGRTLREIQDDAEKMEEEYESAGLDYRLIRGLYILLERRSTFERPETRMDPVKAREIVYRIVNQRYGGFVTEDYRREALQLAADELGMSAEELEFTLWADFDPSLRLVGFDKPSPEDLLKEYNLSLLQTAMFKSVRMEVLTSSSGNEVKYLMRAVKRLGLMYMPYKWKGVLKLSLDGPASVLKFTTKYGMAMAKLVPYVASLSNWSIRARIVRRIGRRKRIVLLEVDDTRRDLFPDMRYPKLEYDSSLEKEFARACSAGGWTVVREPEPLVADGSLVIPDFLLKKGPIGMYVEVVGFWTPDYIKRKVEKLRLVKEPVLLVARKDLLCSKIETTQKEVLYFERRIDHADLARKLKEVEKKLWNKKKNSFKEVLNKMKLEEDVISLRDLSSKLGVTSAQLRDICCPKGYELVGDYLISSKLLDVISRRTTEERPRRISDLRRILRDLKVPEELAVPLAERAGVKVIWKGLDEEMAELSYSPH